MSPPAAFLPSDLEQNGFAIIPCVVTPDEQLELLDALGPPDGVGRRGLLGVPAIARFALSEKVLDLVRPHLTAEPKPVRAIYFHKSAEANWLVPWHQDLTLAVRARAEVPGFGPWSTKDVIPHVQPPVELLSEMLTVRLHFDDTDAANGALRVLPGSHRFGRLSAGRIQTLRAEQPEVTCASSAGCALLMRPLLLHASGRITSPRQRRVLHVEYASFHLPPELHWHEAA